MQHIEVLFVAHQHCILQKMHLKNIYFKIIKEHGQIDKNDLAAIPQCLKWITLNSSA